MHGLKMLIRLLIKAHERNPPFYLNTENKARNTLVIAHSINNAVGAMHPF
jgi:hypothetical protein